MHQYVWQRLPDGKSELWVYPQLAYRLDQWRFINRCLEMVRAQAQDQQISDSKCIEFLAAEYAASYGLEMDDAGN